MAELLLILAWIMIVVPIAFVAAWLIVWFLSIAWPYLLIAGALLFCAVLAYAADHQGR